jgi:succinate dehydrogenase / fumarate reductase cytochrome b subunit
MSGLWSGDTVKGVAIHNQERTLVRDAQAVRSTVFLKILMAVSGLVFIGFVLGHMYGNLKAFSGQGAYDDYAHHLRVLGEPMLPRTGFLWIMRVGLIAALLVHVYAAAALWRRAKNARTVKYQMKKSTGAIFASRLMRWGGVTLLLFLIWHLLEFTIVKINVGDDATTVHGAHSPYLLLVSSFSVWWLTIIYLIAMLALGAHLHHGFWSATQTLGLTGSVRTRKLAKRTAFGLAVLIAGGFSLVPLGVLFGIIEK